MANKTINDFTAKTALATTDYFLMQETGGTTKKVAAPNISSCGQLKFPATQNASADANTLDDYEEGTFTPVLYCTTDAGVGTYSTQSAKYVKIGSIVYIDVRLVLTNHTGTGNMRISGLPFNPVTSCSMSIYVSGLTFSNQISAIVITTGYISPRTFASDGAGTEIDVDTAFTMFIAGTYTV